MCELYTSTFLFYISFFSHCSSFLFFFFNATPTTEIYTLSLHDALPISAPAGSRRAGSRRACPPSELHRLDDPAQRSEEHTSELQSRPHLVCRLLLEKKKKKKIHPKQLT